MALWDIVGPVMIGPSSSHTAGAARIGYLARCLWGEPVKNATLFLRGSFATTGKGHGTDKALIAGLLGMRTDDIRIKYSFAIAKEAGFNFIFDTESVVGAHPNSVRILIENETRKMEIVCNSIGGGNIMLHKLDGVTLDLDCKLPTVVIFCKDEKGSVTAITKCITESSINIAAMKLSRSNRGGDATMVLEIDSAPEDAGFLDKIAACHPAIQNVRLLEAVS